MECRYSLFSDSEITRYIQHISVTESDRDIIRSWYNRLQDRLLIGEQQNYLDFYDEILRNFLGYGSEDRKFERPTRSGRRVEFCIVDKQDRPILVFELKGQNAILDKRPTRGKLSPVEQAHQYAYDLKGTWYIACNYDEFWIFNYFKPQRCYKLCIRNVIDEEGEIKDEEIRKFKALLSREQVLENQVLRRLNESMEFYERTFTNNFYNLFHETRLILVNEFQTNNDLSVEESLRKAQLVLNRLLFCLFAEDGPRGLLPSNILEKQIMNPLINAEVRSRQNRIWTNILNLFDDIHRGNRFNDIPAYDGEIFTEDLTELVVRDILEDPAIHQDIRIIQEQQLTFEEEGWFTEVFGQGGLRALSSYIHELNPIYIDLLKMASFDFTTEVNVDILGRVFELSLTDLENFTDVYTSRDNAHIRLSDGIYYTPEFVTEYITRRSLIYHLRENETVLTFDQLIEDFSDRLILLETKVRQTKILDPACGSGAFLVKTVELLTELYEKIYNARVAAGEYNRSSTNGQTTLDVFFDEIDTRRQIILENIYGVDKNPESVELTKLSLFLQIAKREVEFPSLNDHVKCGNSIVNDSQIVEDPFNWQSEFPSILQDGGFDIIVGNPPWGADLSEYRDYMVSEYSTIARGQFDSFAIFLFHNLRDLLKDNGIIGYIIPNELCLEDVNAPLRIEVNNHHIFELLNLGLEIFEGVTKPSLILILKKDSSPDHTVILTGLSQAEKQQMKERELGIELLTRERSYSRNQSSFVIRYSR